MKELIENIHRFSENGLFLDEASLAEVCKEFLLYKGYKIISPIIVATDVKKIDDLIHYFYNTLRFKHPDLYSVERNKKKDRHIAKLFIESRQKASGIKRPAAIQECLLIIDTVFSNEDVFSFRQTPNFSIFGQDKLEWVTIKAVDIINKNMVAKRRDNKEKLMVRYEEEALKRLGSTGYSDLDIIISRMEAKNAKKEKRKRRENRV